MIVESVYSELATIDWHQAARCILCVVAKNRLMKNIARPSWAGHCGNEIETRLFFLRC
jgi:hypothetical protein